MAPVSTKFASVFALLASSVLSVPIQERDLVVQTAVQTETDIVATVTDWVYVTAGASSAAASAATSAVSSAAVAASATPAVVSPDGNGAKAHGPIHSFGPPSSATFISVPSSVAAPPSSTVAPPAAPTTTAAPAPASSTSVVAPAPAPTTLVTSASSVAPAPSTTAAPAPVTSATSAAPAPSSTSVPTGSVTKRGLAFTDISLCSLYNNYKMGWGYNWGSSAGGSLSSGMEYVPLLWGTQSVYTNSWDANVEKALASGSSHLMAFNEPDLDTQANLSPAAAATAYQQYMNKYAGQAKLGSPAVTNGGGDMGLTWLQNFQDACNGACHIDFTPIHWYDSATNFEYFKSHLTQAHEQTGLPIWLTEFGATGSDDQISSFLEQAIPWLESQDWVERYSYYMVGNGYLVQNNALSSYGVTYGATN